jgi:hypothetical protein
MVKPIGHMTANLASSDKVSHRTRARFGPQSALAGLQVSPPAAGSGKKARKFKTRKK